ncbi:MAG: hypothetical protein ABSA47_20295 [Verrucomicrobiota bacterium]|jgi:hypothetical protein
MNRGHDHRKKPESTKLRHLGNDQFLFAGFRLHSFAKGGKNGGVSKILFGCRGHVPKSKGI